MKQKKNLISQKLVGFEQKITSLEIQSNKLKEDLTTYNSEVEAFLIENITATACLGASGMALDETNEYAESAKDLSKAVAVVCLIALLDEDFRNQVFAVGKKLVQADTHVKNLKSQIRSLQSKIDAEKSAAAERQSEYDRLQLEIEDLELQLSKL